MSASEERQDDKERRRSGKGRKRTRRGRIRGTPRRRRSRRKKEDQRPAVSCKVIVCDAGPPWRLVVWDVGGYQGAGVKVYVPDRMPAAKAEITASEHETCRFFTNIYFHLSTSLQQAHVMFSQTDSS